MSYLVISTSLHPDSKSRILANRAVEGFAAAGETAELLDLSAIALPFCDGDECDKDENVQQTAARIRDAEGIVLATPIYNYAASSSAKNLIELTGRVWTGKVVGFLCAAGGANSHMAIMGLVNSLMLDFRTLIVPRFVYCQEDAFQGDSIGDPETERRVDQLSQAVVDLARVWNQSRPTP